MSTIRKLSDFPAPIVGGAELRAALGFRTAEAFRAAYRGGRLPVKVMKLEGRRGWFALAADVARWQSGLVSPPKDSEHPKGGGADS